MTGSGGAPRLGATNKYNKKSLIVKDAPDSTLVHEVGHMAGLHDVEPTYLFEDRRIMEQYTVGNVRNMVMINCPINGDEVVAFELGKQGGGIPE